MFSVEEQAEQETSVKVGSKQNSSRHLLSANYAKLIARRENSSFQ
jgi:hypothetical protein